MVGDGLPEIPRIPPPPPSIANESLSLFLRPARFDFTARYGMSCLEYARATTNLAPRIRESTRIRLCRESNLFHLFVVETFHPIFWINFFFFCTSFSIFNRIFSWQLARRYYNDFSYIRFNFNKANLVVHLRRDDSKQHWKHSIEVS